MKFCSFCLEILGYLRAKVRNWLCACDDKHCTSNCCCTLVKLLKSLCDFPRNFIGLHGSVSVSVNYDDEELDAWELEAIRWARVVFLVIKEDHHLDPILTVNLLSLPAKYECLTFHP